MLKQTYWQNDGPCHVSASIHWFNMNLIMVNSCRLQIIVLLNSIVKLKWRVISIRRTCAKYVGDTMWRWTFYELWTDGENASKLGQIGCLVFSRNSTMTIVRQQRRFGLCDDKIAENDVNPLQSVSSSMWEIFGSLILHTRKTCWTMDLYIVYIVDAMTYNLLRIYRNNNGVSC